MFAKISLKSLQIIGVFIVTITFTSCDSEDAFTIENAKILDFQSFTLEVPQNWTKFSQQGIDTYIGGLTNQTDTLFFDFGYLSFGSLDNIEVNDETISFQTLHVNGVDAKIVKEKREEEPKIRYSLYLDNRDNINLNRIYGYGLSDEQLTKAIFLSHKFTE